MPDLLILRHGKASRDDPDQRDEDRPLVSRGREASLRMGEFLAARGLVPDLCLSSTAVRALMTAAYAACGGRFALRIDLRHELYHAAPSTILAVVAGAARGARRILVVGHNPGMAELVAMVARSEQRFPTAALAHVALDASDPASIGGARLLDLWRPKELFAGEPE
jgi:phosphohistidine phosphatase